MRIWRRRLGPLAPPTKEKKTQHTLPAFPVPPPALGLFPLPFLSLSMRLFFGADITGPAPSPSALFSRSIFSLIFSFLDTGGLLTVIASPGTLGVSPAAAACAAACARWASTFRLRFFWDCATGAVVAGGGGGGGGGASILLCADVGGGGSSAVAGGGIGAADWAFFFFFFGVVVTAVADPANTGFAVGGGGGGTGVGATAVSSAGTGDLLFFSGLGLREADLEGASTGASMGEPEPEPELEFILAIAAREDFLPARPRHFSRWAAKREERTFSLSHEVHLK